MDLPLFAVFLAFFGGVHLNSTTPSGAPATPFSLHDFPHPHPVQRMQRNAAVRFRTPAPQRLPRRAARGRVGRQKNTTQLTLTFDASCF